MEVLYVAGDERYDKLLCDALEAYEIDGKRPSLSRYTSDKNSVEAFFTRANTVSSSCIIVPVSNILCVERILEVMVPSMLVIEIMTQLFLSFQSPYMMNNNRVLFLTSFLTWGGKKFNNCIYDIDKEFGRRVPLRSVTSTYFLENRIHAVSTEKKNSCLIGIGVVYGGGGCDLESLFR